MLGDQLRNDPTLVVSDGFDAYRSVIDRKLAFPTVLNKKDRLVIFIHNRITISLLYITVSNFSQLLAA